MFVFIRTGSNSRVQSCSCQRSRRRLSVSVALGRKELQLVTLLRASRLVAGPLAIYQTSRSEP